MSSSCFSASENDILSMSIRSFALMLVVFFALLSAVHGQDFSNNIAVTAGVDNADQSNIGAAWGDYNNDGSLVRAPPTCFILTCDIFFFLSLMSNKYIIYN